MGAGEADQGADSFYCAQHFHYVVEYLNWLAYEASQIRNGTSRPICLKISAMRNPDDRHLDMLKDYVAACGVNPDGVEGSIVLGGTDQLQNWGWRWFTKSLASGAGGYVYRFRIAVFGYL